MCSRRSLSRSVPLHKHTTLRVGGVAEYFAEPASRAELLELVRDARELGVPYRVLGRGSNVYVAGDVVPGLTVRLTSACHELRVEGNRAAVGASVPLQHLLKHCARLGLGGMPYLHSVPGNVGGAIRMNAGRGRQHRQAIGDHVVSVTYFDGGEVRTRTRRQCRFRHRESVFHREPHSVILGAVLDLERMPPERASDELRERIEFVRRTQDNTAPNAGSVFSARFALAKELQGVRQGGVEFSGKTGNWILNHGGTDPADVASLLETARAAHLALGLPEPKLEWTVWP